MLKEKSTKCRTFFSKCEIHYKISILDKDFGSVVSNSFIFDSHSGNSFHFVSGLEQVPSGLDKSVQSMKKGEVAIFHIRSSELFGEQGYNGENFKIPPNTDLQYEIHLIDIEKEKETWSMEAKEKVDTAKSAKEEGNKYFTAGRSSLAQNRYKRALSCIEYGSFEDGFKDDVKQLKLAIFLNLAAVAVKQKSKNDIMENTKKALEIEPNNPKALYRKAQGLIITGDWEEAVKLLTLALEKKNPENKEITKELVKVKEEVKKQDEKDAQIYKRMLFS